MIYDASFDNDFVYRYIAPTVQNIFVRLARQSSTDTSIYPWI